MKLTLELLNLIALEFITIYDGLSQKEIAKNFTKTLPKLVKTVNPKKLESTTVCAKKLYQNLAKTLPFFILNFIDSSTTIKI